jgi:polysaccharide transporter, PST family
VTERDGGRPGAGARLRALAAHPRALAARRPLLARLAGNAAWLVGDKLLRMGAGVAVGAWVARYLGPAQFGSLSYAMALVALLTGIASMGLPEILLRDLVRHPEQRRSLMASALLLRLGGGLAVIAISLIAMAVLRPGDGDGLILVLIVAIGPLALAFDVVDVGFQAQTRVRSVILLRNAAFAVTALLRVLAILSGAALPLFAALTTLEFVVAAALMTMAAQRQGLGFGIGDVSRATMRRLIGESWPLLLRGIAVGVYFRVDQILVGQLLGDEAVGRYAVAVRLSEIWNLIPVAIMAAVAPSLVASQAVSRETYERQLVRLMRVLGWGSAGFAVLIGLAAPLLIGLLFGPAYAAAVPVLALHAWAAVAVALGTVSATWLINMGLARHGLWQALAGGIVSVGLNLLLIPRLGIVGAALVQVASQAVSAVLMNAVFPATRPLFRLQLRALFGIG